jgi:ribosomal protein L13E
MKFYSVVKKGWVNVPESKVTHKVRNGRKFAVGKYKYNGKEYEAWKVLGMAGKKKTKK